MTLNNYVDNIYKNSQGIHRIPDVRDDVHPGCCLFRFCTDVYPSPLQRVSVSGHAYFRPINEGTFIHSLRKTDQPGPARTSSDQLVSRPVSWVEARHAVTQQWWNHWIWGSLCFLAETSEAYCSQREHNTLRTCPIWILLHYTCTHVQEWFAGIRKARGVDENLFPFVTRFSSLCFGLLNTLGITFWCGQKQRWNDILAYFVLYHRNRKRKINN